MISMLDKIIMKKKPQNIRIRYYPYSEKQYIDDINILCIKTMSKIEIEKIKAILKDYQHITGRYTEFGIKDTFVRINYDESNNETSRIYFRKQIFILPQDEILQKEFPGIFIIEIFNLCEKEELPHIIDYHYDANYDANTYTISFPMDDKKKNINYKICIINSQYLDFNKDLNINMDINAQINKFTKDIKQHIGKINNIIC